MGEVVVRWVKWVKGIKKYKLPVIKSHRDAKYSIENIVDNIVMTMYGVRWVPDSLG